jgi:hypothetical protein
MSHNIRYQTTTAEGNKVRIEGPEIPTSELLQQGELPSNQDIEEGLQKTKTGLQEAVQEGHLDAQGRKLEKDLEGIIDSTGKLLEEKNPDEQFQEMMKESKQAIQVGSQETSKLSSEMKAQMELKPQVKSLVTDSRQLYAYIRSLSWNFVRSSEFRDLLADWIQYFLALTMAKVKEEAIKQEGETQIGQAVAEGLKEPSKPASKEELQERTEETLYQLLSRVSSKPEYQDFFNNLLELFDMINGYLKLREKTPMTTEHLQKAFQDARDFISHFTGREELEEFINLFQKFYDDVSEDQELTQWFCDVRVFMESTLQRPESITEEERKSQANQLTDRGRLLLQKEKWRNDLSQLKEQFRLLLDKIRTDSTSQEWTSKFEQFGKDLLFNAQGEPDIFVLENSIYQLKNMMIPLFKRTLENIPIKRIDVSTDTYDVRVEDILFDATTFAPEHLDFKLLNVSHLDFKDERKDVVRHQMQLRVDHIKPVFKNLKFYYLRKSFPKIEDYGVADLALTGDGGTINVIWTVESRGNSQPVAILSLVECTIDKLNIHIVGEATKHDWLDAILAPLISSRIKKSIASTLEDYFKDKLNDANDRLNEWLSSRPWYQAKLKADEKLKEAYKSLQQEQPILTAK